MSTNNVNSNNYNYKHYTKIIVLDDDFDIATLVKRTLHRNGFENVSAFTNPLLALEHFKINHNDYSLVISDIRMPGLNGFEFANYINRIKPDIKIILMTAFDINDDLLAMNVKYNNNISGIIQKPVSPKKLAKIVAGTKVIGV